MTKHIAYWIFNYVPEWEAASKEVKALHEATSEPYSSHLIAMNMRRRKLSLSGSEKHIPLPWGLVGLPVLKFKAASYDINHLFISLSERILLPRICNDKTIVTATKGTASFAEIEKHLPHLANAHAVVVESEFDKDVLLQAGLAGDQVKLIYPGVDVQPYVAPSGPFKILFASSPTYRGEFLTRGIHLVLSVAKRLPEVQFIFAWRDNLYQEIQDLIAAFGVTNVEVRNGQIDDMNALYQSVHATIVPGLAHNSFKPCPHSALESLAHGKPMLVSKPTSLSRLVQVSECGVVFEPTIEKLEGGIVELESNYNRYQANCYGIVKERFSRAHFLDAYRQLYDNLKSEI